MGVFAWNLNSDCLFVCRVLVISRTQRKEYVLFWDWALAYAYEHLGIPVQVQTNSGVKTWAVPRFLQARNADERKLNNDEGKMKY